MTSIFCAFLNSDLLGFVTIRTLFQISILGKKNQGYELKKKSDRKDGKLRENVRDFSWNECCIFTRFFKVPKSKPPFQAKNITSNSKTFIVYGVRANPSVRSTFQVWGWTHLHSYLDFRKKHDFLEVHSTSISVLEKL